jgi:hypothetical protein
MATINYTTRTGKDFFQYMQLSIVNQERANEWAATNFVEINGSPLDLDQYLKLKPIARDKIVGSLFSLRTPDGYESDDDIVLYEDENGIQYTVKKKKIKHSLLLEIQTIFESANNNRKKYVKCMKESLTTMFDVTLEEIDTFPYPLVGGMVNELQSFLSESTRTKASFVINDDELFSE